MTGPMLSDVPDHRVPDHTDRKPLASNTCLTGLLQAVTLFAPDWSVNLLVLALVVSSILTQQR